ncbi:MAG: hypothetical protein AVDCRST_MAG51-318, partial [uncultured Ramlibacter sp.]
EHHPPPHPFRHRRRRRHAARPARIRAGPGRSLAHRQHAGADRALVGHRADAQAGGRDLRRRLEQARRPARSPGAVDREGRPVQARPGAHAVRATGHQRQGRPAHGPLRHRRHPVGDGRGPALQQGAGAPHLRHPVAGQVRHAVPGLVARPQSAGHRVELSVRHAGRFAEAAQDHCRSHQQVPVDPLHVAGRARGGQEAGPAGGAVPRVGLRQPRLRPDRRARQGCQPRPGLDGRHRPGRQHAARRDEEDRLRAAAALPPVPGARPDDQGARRHQRAGRHHLRGAPALHQQPGGGGVRQDLQRARQGRQPARHLGGGAGRGVVLGLADPGGRRAWRQQLRRQGDRGLAEEEPGRHHPGQPALRRSWQLRRRPDEDQAG